MTIVVSLLVMWLWIYLYAPRNNPDCSSSARRCRQPICAAARARIDALPLGRFADTPQDRAVVREGTEITEQLVADLRSPDAGHRPRRPSHPRRPFEDWERAISSTDVGYVERLAMATLDTDDRDLAFIIQERIEGGFYTRRIDGLANVNDMLLCRARRYLSQAFALATLRPAPPDAEGLHRRRALRVPRAAPNAGPVTVVGVDDGVGGACTTKRTS